MTQEDKYQLDKRIKEIVHYGVDRPEYVDKVRTLFFETIDIIEKEFPAQAEEMNDLVRYMSFSNGQEILREKAKEMIDIIDSIIKK